MHCVSYFHFPLIVTFMLAIKVIVNVKWYIVAPARNRDVYLCIRRQMGRNSYKHTQHKLHANGFLNYIHTPDLFEKMNST